MSENEGGYEVLDGGVGLVTIRCRESGQTMTMYADEALGVGRVLAADDIAALTAEVERLRAERDAAQADLRYAQHQIRGLEIEVDGAKNERDEARGQSWTIAAGAIRLECDSCGAVMVERRGDA